MDTTLIDDWLDQLDVETYKVVLAALQYLQDSGPTTGRPFVDRIHRSRHHNMKELRPSKSSGQVFRILFAFDPTSRAITLVAGDKAGNWDRWYWENIPVATGGMTTISHRCRHAPRERRGKRSDHTERSSGQAFGL